MKKQKKLNKKLKKKIAIVVAVAIFLVGSASFVVFGIGMNYLEKVRARQELIEKTETSEVGHTEVTDETAGNAEETEEELKDEEKSESGEQKTEEKKSKEKKTAENKTGSAEKKPSGNTSSSSDAKSVTKTRSELNNDKRRQMESTFGVKIAYGNEMSSYRVGAPQYNPVKLTDDNTIEVALKTLDEGLSRYPNGFFREIKNFGMPITIYLVQQIGGSLSGLTDHQIKSNVIMTINANGSAFESMLHHEMMHYIDAYLDLKMYSAGTDVCSTISAMNPPDFRYDGTTAHTYPVAGVDGAYSVNSYGKTNCKEDRAEIFRSMMRLAPYPYVFQKAGTPLNAKAKLIAEQIDQYFSTVSPGAREYWERFIY